MKITINNHKHIYIHNQNNPECKICGLLKSTIKPIAPEQSDCNCDCHMFIDRDNPVPSGHCQMCRPNPFPISLDQKMKPLEQSPKRQCNCCKCYCKECAKKCWHSKCKVHVEPVKSTWEDLEQQVLCSLNLFAMSIQTRGYDDKNHLSFTKRIMEDISKYRLAERKEMAGKIEGKMGNQKIYKNTPKINIDKLKIYDIGWNQALSVCLEIIKEGKV